MPGKQVTYIEITPDEFDRRLVSQREDIVAELSGKITELTRALASQAPSLSKEQAAGYCDRSKAWIDSRRKTDYLPVKIVGGHPRFLREHLDHLLCGGKFDKNGNPLPISS